MLHAHAACGKQYLGDKPNKLWRSPLNVVSANSATIHCENHAKSCRRCSAASLCGADAAVPHRTTLWRGLTLCRFPEHRCHTAPGPVFLRFQNIPGEAPTGDGGSAPPFSSTKKGRCVFASSPGRIGAANSKTAAQFSEDMKSFTSVSEMYFCSSMPFSEKAQVTAGADTSPFLSNCTLPVAPWQDTVPPPSSTSFAL